MGEIRSARGSAAVEGIALPEECALRKAGPAIVGDDEPKGQVDVPVNVLSLDSVQGAQMKSRLYAWRGVRRPGGVRPCPLQNSRGGMFAAAGGLATA